MNLLICTCTDSRPITVSSLEEAEKLCREVVHEREGSDLRGFLLDENGVPLYDYHYVEKEGG